jgi:hypothetical protein
MWRFAALVFLLCAGCAWERPSWVPDPGFLLGRSNYYFTRTDDGLLPASPGNGKQP